MPLVSHPPCPGCGKPLIRKPAGKCPDCGTRVAEFVVAEREREERIEKVVAVISTILVLALFVVGGGLPLLEGVAAYAVGGAVVWVMAKKTFFDRRRSGREMPP